MTYHPTQEQWARAEALGSSIGWIHENHRICARLTDTATGRPWHSAWGASIESAVQTLLDTASSRETPKTAAQIAAEHKSQADKINELENKLQDLNPAKKTRKRKPRTPATETAPAVDEVGFGETESTE